MIGIGCVSAANDSTSIQTNVEEMNVEMVNEGNLIQTQSESINQVEKSANMIGLSERNFNKGNGPFHNGINDHTNIKHNQTIKCGENNTNNSNNKTIRGPKIKSKLDIKGPKINETKILKKSKTFNYKGEKVYIALMQNGSERKLCMFKASSGMSGATSSYVGEVGTEIVDILEKEGIISKMAYGAAWLQVKLSKKLAEWCGEDMSDFNEGYEKFLINYWAFGSDTSKYIY